MIRNPTMILYLGFTATFFNAISQIPQVIGTFRYNNLQAISLPGNILLLLSQVLWFMYAIADGSTPLAISSFIVGLCCLTIIIQVYRKRSSTSSSSSPEFFIDQYSVEMS